MESSAKPAKKSASRMALTGRSLAFMAGLGATLIVWNTYTRRQETALAIGPPSAAQEAFFVQGADQPDIATFFRKLTPQQRLAMAQNIGRYTDPQLAKLCSTLLGDFDPEARAVLAKSLSGVAKAHPDAVASQLTVKGSFQYLGISEALRSAGPVAIPYVAKQLSVGDASANAERYLAEAGASSTPFVLPLLSSSDAATRQAAEETLGKLRALTAAPELTRIFQAASGTEKDTALTALASIAAPESEPLLAGILANRSEHRGRRSEAALGLGNYHSQAAALALWQLAQDPDADVRDSVTSALVVCGQPALSATGAPQADRLEVASRIPGPLADGVIRECLTAPELEVKAAAAAAGRPDLVAALAGLLRNPTNAANGDLADAAIRSLESTPQGRASVAGFKSNPALSGFIARREYLGQRSGS